ncbi:MAG: ATP-binding protein [Colwellia sp.]|jgi:two-component system nitrogen regulation sensor histidine kinase NtrY
MSSPNKSKPKGERKSEHKPEFWVLIASLVAILPLCFVSLILLSMAELPEHLFWTLLFMVVGSFIWSLVYLQRRILFALRSISNALMSLAESDYSIRLGLCERGQILDEVVRSVNRLRDLLHAERTGAAETGALFARVVEKVDVALFAFDPNGNLCMVNERGLLLLNRSRKEVLDKSAQMLGLAACLASSDNKVLRLNLAGSASNWLIKKAQYREFGAPRELVIMSDLTAPLREKELEAWQRLVAVLRHEISNALAPIKSYSQTLGWTLRQTERHEGWEQDCIEGLAVIERQTTALNYMMQSYKNLNQLPTPVPHYFDLQLWLAEIVKQELRLPVQIFSGEPLELYGDRELLSQALVNIINNAIEASTNAQPPIISWQVLTRPGNNHTWLTLDITDFGEGVANEDNLFVPFFTTKAKGSGIGLLVCRGIIEVHGGHFNLMNKAHGQGCIARIQLPLPLSAHH